MENEYVEEKVLALYEEGNEELYAVLEELSNEEVEAIIDYWNKHNLAGTYELQQFLLSYLSYRKEN